MFFKVDYDKVEETSNVLLKETEELNNLYFDIVNICKSIDDNWQSEDASVYVAQFIKFIRNQMLENYKLNDAGKVLKRTSYRYSEQDNKWMQDLLKEDIWKKEGKIK